jgi:hypothetical protein
LKWSGEIYEQYEIATVEVEVLSGILVGCPQNDNSELFAQFVKAATTGVATS